MMQGVRKAAFRGCFFVPLLALREPHSVLLTKSISQAKRNGTRCLVGKRTSLPFCCRSLNHGGVKNNQKMIFFFEKFCKSSKDDYLCIVVKTKSDV